MPVAPVTNSAQRGAPATAPTNTTAPATPSFYGAVGANLGNPEYQSQLAGYLGGAAAPGIATSDLALAQAMQSAGESPAALKLGAANLASETGYAYANALTNVQGIGLQSQALGSEIGTAAQQQQVEQQSYQRQLAQLGLTEAGTKSALGYLGTEAGFAKEETAQQKAGLKLQQAQLAYETPLQLQATAGQSAATGASDTVGAKEALGTIREQAAVTGGELGLQQKGATTGLESTLAGLGQQKTQLGLTEQQNALSGQLAVLGQAGEQVGYAGQQEQLANAQQQLGVQAKAAGIPAQQATSQLAYGLQQLGLSTDPTQFLASAANAEGTNAQAYASVLSAAGVLGGLGPQTITVGGG